VIKLFNLELQEYRDSLEHLLNISTNLAFIEDKVCSIHPQLFSFACLRLPIENQKPRVNNCSVLKKILKSKTIKKLRFIPELNLIEIKHPYEYTPKIPEIPDKNLMTEIEKRLEVVDNIDDAEVYEEPSGSERTIVSFMIPNDQFKDMLQQIGQGGKVEIKTGEKLALINHYTQDVIKHPDISTSEEVSVYLTQMTQPILEKSLISTDEQDYSVVYLVDKAFLVVKNQAETLISSGVE